MVYLLFPRKLRIKTQIKIVSVGFVDFFQAVELSLQGINLRSESLTLFSMGFFEHSQAGVDRICLPV